MIRVVLDANQFVSALLKPGSNPDAIMRLVRQEKVLLLMSEAICDEVSRVLAYPKIIKRLNCSREQLDTFVNGLRAVAVAALVDQSPNETERQTLPDPRGRPRDGRSLPPSHGLHGPLRRVVARPRRDEGVPVALLAQEAQDGVQGCQADRAVAQAFGVQPILVETETGGQNVGNSLVEARDEDPTDTGFAHVSG